MNFNPYSVFEMPMSADFETLRATYRRLVRENHPDIAPDKLRATERMAQINRAWSILGDQTRRAAFDAQWRLHLAEQNRREAAQQRTTPQAQQARSAPRREPSRRETTNRETTNRETTGRETTNREPPRREPSRGRATHPGAAPSNSKSAPRSGASGAKNASKNGNSGAARRPSGSASPNASKSAAPRAATGTARPRSVPPPRDGESAPSSRALRLMRKITIATRVWHRDGNARDAIETCRAVLLADGRNVAARELLAEIYVSQHRYELATMMLDQAIQIAPDDQYLRFKRTRIEALSPNSDPRAAPRRSLWSRLRALLNGKRP